ncbi:hypothetical protein [Saccharopolyspora rosea]|uniref:Uncharacterized protein n=1 Tax=Saccharopolyspora rosea TaxID=524884 RepID=A0ABW3FVM6_9PSEU|nr:hypothetical protein [Saccharopolyspora rosea]
MRKPFGGTGPYRSADRAPLLVAVPVGGCTPRVDITGRGDLRAWSHRVNPDVAARAAMHPAAGGTVPDLPRPGP